MVCSANRTSPFPYSKVLDLFFLVPTLRTDLATCKPLVYFDKIVTLILKHIKKHTPPTVRDRLCKVMGFLYIFHIQSLYTDCGIVVRYPSADFVQVVISLEGNMFMQFRNLFYCFLPIV